MPSFIIPFVAFAVVLAHALIDRRTTIVKQKPVRHLRGAFYYCLVWIVLFFVFFFISGKSFVSTAVPVVLFAFLTRVSFFDPLYNFSIGKGILFEGTVKKKRDTSIIDTIEKSIGWPVWVYRIIYFAVYFIYLGIYIYQYK